MNNRNDKGTRSELPGPARSATLGLLQCPDDVFLFAFASGELESAELDTADAHFDSCESCREVVTELALATGGGSLPRGAQIDRYTILDVLGRGGMGTVYRAYDPQLDRQVAIKLMRSDSGGSQSVLADEAISMARLVHPNVVSVFDAGRSSDAVFLAMELVEGRNLGEWARSEKPSRDAILKVFAQAAHGLAAAHRAGMIHRDFKPENVLIQDGGAAKVADFGLARFGHSGDVSDGIAAELALGSRGQSTRSAHSTRSTRSSHRGISGTPAYMAPEQLDRKAADQRSDQFSFCVALYETLSRADADDGGRPFPGKSLGEIRASMDKPLATIPGLPRWLQQLLRRGLSVLPAARFSSMAEIAARLESKRSRGLTVMAGLGIATAVGVGVFALGSRAQVPNPCDSGNEHVAAVWNDTRGQALAARYSKTPLAQSVAPVLDALDRFGANWARDFRTVCESRTSKVESEDLVDKRMQCLGRRLSEVDAIVSLLETGDPVLLTDAAEAVASVRETSECVVSDVFSAIEPPASATAANVANVEKELAKARALLSLGRFPEAETMTRRLWDQATAIGYPPLLAEVGVVHSDALLHVDRDRLAQSSALTSLEAATIGRDDRNFAEALLALAASTGKMGDSSEALRWAALAEAAIVRLGQPADLMIEHGRLVGVLATNRGDYELASRSLGDALDRVVPGSLATARLLSSLGNVERARGELEQALKLHLAALENNRSALGPGHPALARNLHNIAGVLRRQSKWEEALEHYRESLAIKRSVYGDNHSAVALTRNSIAVVHIERDELESAAAELGKALAIYESTVNPERAGVLRNMGLIAERRAKLGEAESFFERALSATQAEDRFAQTLGADLVRVREAVRVRTKRSPKAKGKGDSKSAGAKTDKPKPTYMSDQVWRGNPN